MKPLLLLLALLVAFGRLAMAAKAPSLEEGFITPPSSARPHTWWHFMDGNITATGITKDLEAMAEAGIGGVQLFDVALGLPSGPVDYASPEWFALMQHAISEADRLGIEVCFHNCAGWSSSGGPWVTPELAMQRVTFNETRFKGPGRFTGKLPQPWTKEGFYRDIAVIAFPTPKGEAGAPAPEVTVTQPGVNLVPLFDGNPESGVGLVTRLDSNPVYLNFDYPAPFTATSLTVIGGGSAVTLALEASDDGETWTAVTQLGIGTPNVLRCPQTVAFAPVTARHFRIGFPQQQAGGRAFSLSEIALEAAFRLPGWGVKTGLDRGAPGPYTESVSADYAILPYDLVDLTDKLGADGSLDWEAPKGEWTILRLGHTLTGKHNHPVRPSGDGLEIDKMSKAASDFHFAQLMDKLITNAGPLAGKTLNNTIIDSYETDCQNWSTKLPQEFEARRGYNLAGWLPALTGRIVGKVDQTERFLWDFRKTLAECWADNYWGEFGKLAHEKGLMLSTEPYGNGNFDDLTAGGRADIPMTEFWVGGSHEDTKLAASIAHTRGNRYVGAESFTTGEVEGRWSNYPYKLKTQGDAFFCQGVNRIIYHRYAHQPFEGIAPGITMGPHGLHHERTITWWKDSSAWQTYMARCQWLLQEGLFQADLLYWLGENSPVGVPGRGGLRPVPPAGYDYDVCDTEILMQLRVVDGKLVLPSGMRYGVLVLNEQRLVRPEVLEKVASLLETGATVVAARPERSPSLMGYPHSDERVSVIAQWLWADIDGQKVTEKAFGKGRLVWGKPLVEVLTDQGLAPDFEYSAPKGFARLMYIHRKAGETDSYFVSNQLEREVAVDCTFRIAGKLPELWHPDTGKTEPAPFWRQEKGRTIVSLRLEPAGSVFVVFRKPGQGGGAIGLLRNGKSAWDKGINRPHELIINSALYGVLSTNLPDCVDVTRQLTKLINNGRLEVTASNGLAGDPAANISKRLRVDYISSGVAGSKVVGENQLLVLPEGGATGGTLELVRAVYGVFGDELPSATPRAFDVTKQFSEAVVDGHLSIAASNDLAGDPASLVVKQLRVEYTLDGRQFTKTVGENAIVEIPDGSESGREEFPAAELAITSAGKLQLTAYKSGLYVAPLASGEKLTTLVEETPRPVELAGPWHLSFPADWGAPAAVELPELIDWTDHPDPGVRYFSGTGTYELAFALPDEALAKDSRLMLDLGDVKYMAEVAVNGEELGTLWKPPFRLDITSAVKSGANSLVVRVTNLWPNRLIGDEALPAEVEWRGPVIAAWPDWLVKGTPRQSERVTFTTWHHYNEGDPLFSSGLLGPVTLHLGKVVEF